MEFDTEDQVLLDLLCFGCSRQLSGSSPWIFKFNRNLQIFVCSSDVFVFWFTVCLYALSQDHDDSGDTKHSLAVGGTSLVVVGILTDCLVDGEDPLTQSEV